MKKYTARGIVLGYKIGQSASSSWVAVPDKLQNEEIEVFYGGKSILTINNWRTEAKLFKQFKDKFGRDASYTLGYFKLDKETAAPLKPVVEAVEEPQTINMFDIPPIAKEKDKSRWA